MQGNIFILLQQTMQQTDRPLMLAFNGNNSLAGPGDLHADGYAPKGLFPLFLQLADIMLQPGFALCGVYQHIAPVKIRIQLYPRGKPCAPHAHDACIADKLQFGGRFRQGNRCKGFRLDLIGADADAVRLQRLYRAVYA